MALTTADLTEQMRGNKLQAKLMDDILRREESAKYIDFYNNDQIQHTCDHIAGIYSNTYAEIVRYIKAEYLTKRIIDIMSLMFQQDPSIEVEGMSETQLIELVNILHNAEAFRLLDLTQKLCNNYLKIGLWPRWDAKRKETYIELITPDNMIAIQDPDRPTMIDAIMVNIGILDNTPIKAEPVNRYLYISGEEWNEVEFNERNGQLKVLTRETNPYGRIPIAFFSLHPNIANFWGECKNDIVQTNLYVNEFRTNLAIMIHYQSFSTLVRTGSRQSLEEMPIKFGPQYSIDIATDPMASDQHADVKYITPDAMIKDCEEYIQNMVLNLATSHSISASAYRADNQQARSGYSIRLDRADLIAKNKQQRSYFYRPMQDLIKLVMATEQLYPEGRRFGELKTIYERNVVIKFGDIEIDEDPIIVAELRAKNIALGIASPVEYIQEDNPELSEEEAAEKYRDIQDLKRGGRREADDEIDAILGEGETERE